MRLSKTIYSIAALGLLMLLAAGSADEGGSSSNTDRSFGVASNSGSSEKVQNSEWDGSVRQVKDYLKKNLKDPKSTEYIEWSPVQKTPNGGYAVRVKYRSKNSFGGFVVENQIFYLDSNGNVTNYMDFD